MPLFRKADPHALSIAMTGIKMGDRFLQVGYAEPHLGPALASKVGLTGRAAVIVEEEAAAARARKEAGAHGVLLEVEVGRFDRLSLDDESFDLAVVDSTGGLLGAMRPETRARSLQEIGRVLRPGGRVIVVERTGRGGLGALFSNRPVNEANRLNQGATGTLKAEGFVSVRVLAERDGLRFVEGVKRRPPATAP